MTKRFLFLIALGALLVSAVSAQKIGKPTLTPVEPTESQMQLISEGIRLHDSGRYAEAMKKYEQVLKENPDCDQALYELALSAYYAKDYAKALETSYKLVKYKSNTATAGYGVLANTLDDQGKPGEAIDIYKAALKQLENEPGYGDHVASLYYNLGITYSRQKKDTEAREALKKAVNYNFSYASPHYLLTRSFYAYKYKIPALLAASRLVSLELNTERTRQAVAVIKQILPKPRKNEETKTVNIIMDLNAPKDEGDFDAMELIMGTLMTVKGDKDKDKSEGEILGDVFDTVIVLLDEQTKLRSTFVGKTYIPFMVEMKRLGHSRTFAYLVLQQGGDQEARKWLVSNEEKFRSFLDWSKSYRPGR